MTKTCHVCGAERPEEKIGVFPSKMIVTGVKLTTNVLYCADKPECASGAKTVARRWKRGK